MDNRLLGIMWMLATMFCFITLDAIMKLALGHYSLIQVTWGRFFFATLFAALYCGRGLPLLARSKAPLSQLSRSVFLMITTWLFNAGVVRVPLATATTIMYLTPILTTVLSVVFLREFVGLRRWFGICLGFTGALIVVQPWNFSMGNINIGVLFLLAAAVSNAIYQIVTRKVRVDDPRTSLLFTAAAGAVVTSFILPFEWQSPDVAGWALLAASGFAGAVGHLCVINAFKAAPASVVAPYSYSSLIWATSAGYFIWGDWPGSNVWAGAALIIASGLYILFREQKKHIENGVATGQPGV